MFTKTFLSTIAVTTLLATFAAAICPGYNFGITQTGSNTNPDYGVWQVFDDSCNVVYQVIATNPCTVGVFDCSPAPITFTGLHLDGLDYACRSDVNSGSCNGDAIQVCCRNDGN
ncbi:hypothetical protein EDD16DRAFT_1704491 [Pisolithus croceorrhizus]|nr:hypothetical protein EDD16DRAFT_1704491 [Pisolithus croceorrhizus]KAI6125245.1 hypothetical protein EV401DRAFT_1938621 [Pisolithus croceorrhizus]KAI6158908.1 hypothetical protein EDD17DRAFT_1487584 [Pisolithus thermaeus]